MKQSNQRISLEVIAPPKTWEDHVVQEWTATVVRILGAHGISYLNLPEVIDEVGPGKRTFPYSSKMDLVRFGELIRSQRPEIGLIPHVRSVRLPKRAFTDRVQRLVDMNIEHIVAVGGESHSIDYPGLSVPEAAAFVRRSFPGMTVGGITIFTREDEVERIITKLKSGITFFLSQIVFEASSMKQVLSELKVRCENEQLELPAIYVSLAPAARIQDLEFMRWLGVQLPPGLLTLLESKNERSVETQTFEMLKELIDDVADFTSMISTDVGFNIGHVVYANLGLSEKLVDLVKSRADA